jgi:hypothetical protein
VALWVVLAVVVGGGVVAAGALAEVVGALGAGADVAVVEATSAFLPPQPATARTVRMAIAVLFIGPR